MKNRNICKFISEPSFEKLETYNFIYETDVSAMSTESKLSTHRAFLIKSGCGSVIIDGAEVTFEPGSLVFAFPLRFRVASLIEGFAVVNDSPVDCQSRERTDPQGDAVAAGD